MMTPASTEKDRAFKSTPLRTLRRAQARGGSGAPPAATHQGLAAGVAAKTMGALLATAKRGCAAPRRRSGADAATTGAISTRLLLRAASAGAGAAARSARLLLLTAARGAAARAPFWARVAAIAETERSSSENRSIRMNEMKE